MTNTRTPSSSPAPARYLISDGDGEVLVRTRREALRAARRWIEDGDWEPSTSTWWTDVVVTDRRTGERVHEVTHRVVPEEPSCDGGEHDWREGRSTGHGGGVIVRDRCSHCGWERVTDTWPQRPDTGETMAGAAVSYERGEQDPDEREYGDASWNEAVWWDRHRRGYCS